MTHSDYETRVRALEAQGATRSDAQAVVDAEDWLTIKSSICRGGEWLRAAREWMQINVQHGDALQWGSGEPVTLPFSKLEELALTAATAAVKEHRQKQP